MSRVALVTGANKGIGLEIAKKLLNASLTVLLGARNAELGKEAVASLNNKRAKFLLIDLTNEKTIRDAAQHVKDTYGGLDILVNNAGIAYKGDAWGEDVARTTVETNYYGTRKVCEAFLPIMRPGGRVVNVCSTAGSLSKLKGDDIRKAFADPDLTVEKLDKLVTQFIEAVRDDTYEQQGFQKSTYGVSKIAESMYTRILQKDPQYKHLLINAVCPGWCSTDMSSHRGMKTAEQGAETPVMLALQPEDSTLQPGFYTEGKLIDW